MKSKKKMAVIGLFCLLPVVSLWVFFHEGAEPKTFMDEVKAVRAKSKAATQIPIHDLVAKYIPAGTPKDVALEFCKASGLKIYPVPDKQIFRNVDPKTYDEAITCSKYRLRWDSFWLFWIGSDTVWLTIGIKDGVVVWTVGAISFASL
jgi:hypothetical protein